MEKTNVVVESKGSAIKIYLPREDCGSCGGSKGKYFDAKRKERHAIYTAKGNAEKEKFGSVKYNKEKIFRVSKQLRTENQDVIEGKWMRRDDGSL